MDLTADDFNRLSSKEQLRLTFEKGREVMARTYLYYTVKLFRIDTLFIEVWYRPHHNRVDKAEAVDLDDVLHLYEKEIDISDIFAG